ncbi:MAG: hypothetical protein JJ863_28975 [Deltaproteobacteria bacterium]|nr:hypothetical protein [Deltaproteobacteria bacterium]
MRPSSLLSLAVLLLTGCLSFDPPAGRLECSSDSECPNDWGCRSDGRCHPPGELDAGNPDAGLGDAGPADGGEPDAAVCEEPCRLIAPQCGCPSGRGCYPNGDLTAVSCEAAGTTPEREVCTGAVNSCEPGMGCVVYPTANLCIRFCENDADCTGGPGSFCARVLSGGGQEACTFSCDLTEQNCPSGFRCEPGTIPPATARTATDCIEVEGSASGGAGDSCSSFRDCLPGFTCASGQCLEFCRFGTSCPSGGPCSELSPAIVIGDQEFGACPP